MNRLFLKTILFGNMAEIRKKTITGFPEFTFYEWNSLHRVYEVVNIQISISYLIYSGIYYDHSRIGHNTLPILQYGESFGLII
jgi:hypothetical protein